MRTLVLLYEGEVVDDDDNEDDESVDMKTKNYTRSAKEEAIQVNQSRKELYKEATLQAYVRSEGSVECRSG